MKKTFMMLLCVAFVLGMTVIACSKDDDSKTVENEQEQVDEETPGENEGEVSEGEENEGEENEGEENEGNENQNPGNGSDDEDTPASLTGSDYYVIVLDDDSYELISDNVELDLRAGWYDEDGNSHGDQLWIWEGTYEAGTSVGLNFYGGFSEWCSLVMVGSWAGLGWCTYLDEEDGALEHNINNTDYYLHFAYKSKQSGTGHELYLCGPDGTEGNHIYFGETAPGSEYNLVAPVSGEYVSDEWNEYEIPVSTFGLDWSTDYYTDGQNFLCVLSNGNAVGTTLDLDAVFIYKK